MKSSALAKITKPQVAGVLRRERLFRLITSRSERPILWICGPAGAGKTTLAASYLDTQPQPCLWYQVDEGDGDIATFFYYLGLAVNKAAPRRGKQFTPYSPEYLPGISVYAKRYFEDLFSRLLQSAAAKRNDKAEAKYILVLDNYQEVSPEAPLHGLLANGLEALPAAIQVVIISRGEPPPQYARLRANERIEVLGRNDISFTRAETGDLLGLQTRKTIKELELEVLFSRFRGWAAGLVLLNESLRTGNIDLSFLEEAPQPEGIFEYFAEEVFNRLEKDIRDVLLKTSFLPQMTPRLVGALAGINNAAAILDDLNRRNCFTEKRAVPHLTYQYHPLFREFLVAKAASTLSREDLLHLKRKAAQLLESSGQIEDAVALLLPEGDWEELLPTLAAHAPSFLAQGRGQAVGEWLRRVPEQVRARNIPLTYYFGLCRMPFDPAESFALLEDSFREAQKQGDGAWALTAWAEAVNTILYGWNTFAILDHWIEWLEKRMATEPHMPSREIEAKVAISMAGALIFRRPDRPEVLRPWLHRALSLAREVKDSNLQAQVICYALQYYSSLGDPANNDIVLCDLRSIPRGTITSPTAVITLKWIEAVTCNWRQADPGAALEIIAEGLRFAEINGVHSGDHFLFAVGAYCALLKGDLARAGDFLARIEKTLDRTRFHSFCQYNYIASLYHLRKGDLAGAQGSAAIALKYALETGIYFPVLFCRLGLAHIFLESGDYEQAAFQLAELRGPLQKTASGILEYSRLLAEAQLFLATGEKSKGLVSLGQAMQLARKKNYTWLFWWWHPKSMARLCACALEAGIEEIHVQRIIRTCKLSPDASGLALGNWPYPLVISTLGRFEIVKDGKPLVFSGKVPRKPLEMLKALIAQGGGREVREEQLSEALWPEADGDAAHKSFEVNLVRLRKLVGPECVRCQSGMVSLEKTCCRVDTMVLETLLQDAEKSWSHAERHRSGALAPRDAAEAVQKSETALGMYSGDFLPADIHHAWTISSRERLRSRTLQLLSRLGAHWEEAGSWEKALGWYRRGLEIDELREEFYQHLMSCRHHLGQKAEAVTAYHQCRQALSARLGISPSAETEELYREIASA